MACWSESAVVCYPEDIAAFSKKGCLSSGMAVLVSLVGLMWAGMTVVGRWLEVKEGCCEIGDEIRLKKVIIGGD